MRRSESYSTGKTGVVRRSGTECKEGPYTNWLVQGTLQNEQIEVGEGMEPTWNRARRIRDEYSKWHQAYLHSSAAIQPIRSAGQYVLLTSTVRELSIEINATMGTI